MIKIEEVDSGTKSHRRKVNGYKIKFNQTRLSDIAELEDLAVANTSPNTHLARSLVCA